LRSFSVCGIDPGGDGRIKWSFDPLGLLVIHTEDLSLIFLAFFFFPVAVYCLILGMINRRPHPVMVSGPWDFLGLLFAASGLILFGGPALLAALYDKSVRDFLLGRFRAADLEFADLLAQWWRIWLFYYIAVVAGGAFLVWYRRGKTAVYNVELALFDETLAQVLDQLGVEWTRMANRIFIGFRTGGNRLLSAKLANPSPSFEPHVLAGAFTRETVKPAPLVPRQDQEAVVDVEPFQATRHITLNWRSSTGLIREEVEAELSKALAELPTRENPAAGWFMVAATALFCIIFLAMALTILFELQHPRQI
jgi:hypothetical protein